MGLDQELGIEHPAPAGPPVESPAGEPAKVVKPIDSAKREAKAKREAVRRRVERLKDAKNVQELEALAREMLGEKSETPATPAAPPAALAPAAPTPEAIAEDKEMRKFVAMAIAAGISEVAKELKGTPFDLDEAIQVDLDGEKLTFNKRKLLTEGYVPLFEKWTPWLIGTPEGRALGVTLLCFGPPAVRAVSDRIGKARQAKHEKAQREAKP